jgi:hypothetical protein
LPLNDARVKRPTSQRRRKDESFRLLSFPILQYRCERRIERDLILGCFGLHSTDAPIHDALLNQHRASSEINVLPPQSQNLGNPEAGAHGDGRHDVVWLPQSGNELLKLLRGKYLRSALASACTSQFHQFDWAALEFNKFPQHGLFKKQVHQGTYGSILYLFGPIVIALMPLGGANRLAKSYIENIFVWNAWPILYGSFGALLTAVQMGQVGQMLQHNDFLGGLGNLEGSVLIGIVSIVYSLAIAIIPFIAKRIVSGEHDSLPGPYANDVQIAD